MTALRLRLGAAAMAASVAVTGCGVSAPLRHAPPADVLPGTLAVVASETTANVLLPAVPGGYAEGALRGGSLTFATCLPQALASAGTCTASGPFAGICAAVPLLLTALCGVFAVGGATYGAAAADSGERVRQNLAGLEAALADRGTLQAMLAASVSARSRVLVGERWAADSARADFRIETQLVELGLGGGGEVLNRPLDLHLNAQARLVRVADGRVLHQGRYRIALGEHPFSEWIADGGAQLQHALQDAYERLGVHIAEQLLLLQPMAGEAVSISGRLVAVFGLAPESPRFTGTIPSAPAMIDAVVREWPRTGPQPTLKWQAFPKAEHRAADPALAERIGDVRYELVIARAHGTGAGEIVYRRDGLTEPQHTVQAPLAAGERYYWTVRAHFTLDGRARVNEWGTTSDFARMVDAVPNRYSYRFMVSK